jgi:hypothetical protein
MKKIFVTIWFVFLIAAGVMTAPFPSNADEGKDTSKAGFSSYGLASKALGDNPHDMFKSLFTSEKDAGKNLYNAMRAKTTVEPFDLALEAVAKKWGFTLAEAQLAMQGNPTPILQKDSHLNVSQAYDQLENFALDLEEMQVLVEEQIRLENDLEMVEIFANGDLYDSGFDLVYDLDIIEQIIFLKGTASDVYTGDDPSKETGYGPDAGDDIKDMYTPTPYGGTSTPKTSSEVADIPDKFTELKEELTEEDDADRDTCSCDQDLLAGVDDYDAGHAADDEDTSGTEAADSSGANNSDTNDLVADLDAFTDDTTEPATEESASSSSGKSSWKKEMECEPGDFICMKLEFIWKEASAYNNSDNCIACHLEKINDAFDKTLKKSLTPNKATGNMFESGKCKGDLNLGGMLDFNIITVLVPPLPPANDELIFAHSIGKEFDKFLARFAPDSLIEVLGSDEKKRSSQIEETTLQAMEYSNMESTASEIFEKIEEIEAQAKAEVAANLERLETEQKVSSGAEMFQALGMEMDQMNMYFNSFKYIFEQIKGPCFETANKPNAPQ